MGQSRRKRKEGEKEQVASCEHQGTFCCQSVASLVILLTMGASNSECPLPGDFDVDGWSAIDLGGVLEQVGGKSERIYNVWGPWNAGQGPLELESR